MRKAIDWDKSAKILLASLFLVLLAGAVLKKDVIVVYWFVALGLWIGAGVATEWINNLRTPKVKRNRVQEYTVTIIGSAPYIAGLLLCAVFEYLCLQIVLGRKITEFTKKFFGQTAILLFTFCYAVLIFAILTGVILKGLENFKEGVKGKRYFAATMILVVYLVAALLLLVFSYFSARYFIN